MNEVKGYAFNIEFMFNIKLFRNSRSNFFRNETSAWSQNMQGQPMYCLGKCKIQITFKVHIFQTGIEFKVKN